MTTGFIQDLLGCLPRLRMTALTMTRGNEDDALDLIQETAAKALANAGRFREGTCLIAWLKTIMAHTHRNNMRTRIREVLVDVAEYEPEGHVYDILSPPEAVYLLKEFLTTLQQHEPMNVHAILCVRGYGETCGEYAARTQETSHAVRSRLNRAIHLLQEDGICRVRDRKPAKCRSPRRRKGQESASARRSRNVHVDSDALMSAMRKI